MVRLDLEPYQGALRSAEVDAAKVDGQALGAVFVRITAGLDLSQCPAFGGELDHFKLEQPDLAVEAQAQVEAAMMTGVFGYQVQSQRCSAPSP